MANRFLKTLASAFVVENENNDTVDAQSTQGGDRQPYHRLRIHNR